MGGVEDAGSILSHNLTMLLDMPFALFDAQLHISREVHN